MQVRNWLYGYGVCALMHLFAIAADLYWLRIITKPLLMIFLLVWFLSATPTISTGKKHFITAAIFFSWLGDLFLMRSGELYFIAGLVSFLIAHLFFILFFLWARVATLTQTPLNTGVILVLLVYVGVFYYYLSPHLNYTLKIPVLVYALVIASMFAAACHSFRKQGGVLIGAGLFIVSDSLLAVNSFVKPFPLASLAVMITYILAQVLIVYGVTGWFETTKRYFSI
ncbi:lysoplasmalogenase [Flavihumibacter sp. ZG627]|uniref:lysoplasmalogenase n=1 Tax=Flavihumibacter sp. ZG627 TaxID=1463156 RepID=UPI00069425DF|nr:lysoplasmalogenase [Flavihumibacter sp. ZG627]